MAFRVCPISAERRQSILSKTNFLPEAPIQLDRLWEVHISHLNFDGQRTQGQLIVLDALAEPVLKIFQEIFEAGFPIHRLIPVDEFGGDDVESMEANNSSAFNSRRIMNTDRWSSHAYGAAIDINPSQNPYVPNPEQEDFSVYPTGGEAFLDRHNLRTGMVETIVPIFKKHGFTEWGGDWKSPLDYHHFQVSWERIHELAKN